MMGQAISPVAVAGATSKITPYRERFVQFLLSKVDVAGKMVLEVGSDEKLEAASLVAASGAGRVIASNMGRYFPDVTARDGVEVKTIDARQMSAHIPPNSIDCIFAIAFLEHIISYDSFLRECHDVLVPGGFAVLHGNPIWTSPLGHHVWVEKEGLNYRFNDATNPIPDWAHLFMEPQELFNHLVHFKKIPQPIAYEIMFGTFLAANLNRKAMSELVRLTYSSPLEVASAEQAHIRAPSDQIARRLAARGYLPSDMSANDLRLVLRKRA